MRHLRLNLLLLGLMSFAAAFGQVTTRQFPALADASQLSAKAPNTFRAPASIDDKSAGQYMYAGQMADQSQIPAWVRFRTANTTNFERIRDIAMDGAVGHLSMLTGAYDTKNATYYGLYVRVYSIGGPWPVNLAKVNVATGDTTTVKHYFPNEQNNWWRGSYLYAMAYNPKADKLYALGTAYYTTADSVTIGYTALYEVDRKSGNVYDMPIQEFDNIYYNFCFDYDGNCYAVKPKPRSSSDYTNVGTTLVRLDDDFVEVDGSEVDIKTPDGGAYLMYYFGTMNFDYTTGDLYWIPYGSSGSNNLYRVNTSTGQLTSVGTFYTGNNFVGLFIPYLTAASRKAPAQVAGLSATPDASGAMNATLQWTNPTLAWDKTTLSGLDSVKVYRKRAGTATTELTPTATLLDNADLVATVTDGVARGQQSRWVDNAPQPGYNTYYVLAVNSAGDGVLDSVRCYMGEDVPGAPTNVKIEKQDNGALSLSWTAPDKGLRNGWINAAGLTYTLTRRPDNVVVAEGLKGTSFVDDTFGEQRNYSYDIQAVSPVGAGGVATSDAVKTGSAFVPPVTFHTATADDADLWTMPNNAWSYNEYWKYVMLTTTSGEWDAYLFSPALQLEAGKTYRFTATLATFYAKSNVYEGTNVSFDLQTALGSNTSSLSGATVIGKREGIAHDLPSQDVTYEDVFTAPTTGVYYYSLDIKTHGASNTFAFKGLAVDCVYGNDLAAQEIGNVEDAVAGTAGGCTVKVRNMGTNRQDRYTVQVVMDDNGKLSVVGETANVPALEAGASADVAVSFTPARQGEFPMYGVVRLEGDERAANDTTAAMTLTVQPEGTAAWTNVVNSGVNENVSSRMPFENYNLCERTQSVYPASEVKGSWRGTIKRIGYIYNGNESMTGPSDDVDVRIYLGQTGKAEFSSTTDALPDADLTLVCETTCSFLPGNDNFLSFNLDKDFAYDNPRSLVVVVEKYGVTEPRHTALWHVYNDSWTGITGYRTLVYDGNNEFSGTYRGVDPALPVLYLAIDTSTGVETVATAGADDAGCQREVYDLSGRKMDATRLPRGIYIVKTTRGDRVTTEKLQVR